MRIKIWFVIAIFYVALAGCKSDETPNSVASPQMQVEDLGVLNVRFSKTFSELTEQSGMENQFLRFTNPVSPYPTPSADRTMHLFLVQFGQRTKFPEVLQQFSESGYAPAPVQALMTVAIEKPDLQKDRDIVWLDPNLKDAAGGTWAGYLGYDNAKKKGILFARGVSFGWSKTAWFLVTRK